MLVAERHKNIINTVQQRGSIRVNELSKLFGFTEETIRRDLEKLEKEGKLLRTHGGAVAIQEGPTDSTVIDREVTNVEEKEAIARIAVTFINEGDSILLDASSTAKFVARHIENKPLTVITNSVRAMTELAPKKKITVICTGGTLSETSLSFIGPLTLDSLDRYYPDKAFISCKAVDSTYGISDSNDMQAMVKKKMIDIADQNFLLADYSKLGKKTMSKVSDLSSIDYLISDEKADETVLQNIRDKNVEILVPMDKTHVS